MISRASAAALRLAASRSRPYVRRLGLIFAGPISESARRTQLHSDFQRLDFRRTTCRVSIVGLDGGVSAWILCESQKSYANVPDIFPELEREAKQRRRCLMTSLSLSWISEKRVEEST